MQRGGRHGRAAKVGAHEGGLLGVRVQPRVARHRLAACRLAVARFEQRARAESRVQLD